MKRNFLMWNLCLIFSATILVQIWDKDTQISSSTEIRWFLSLLLKLIHTCKQWNCSKMFSAFLWMTELFYQQISESHLECLIKLQFRKFFLLFQIKFSGWAENAVTWPSHIFVMKWRENTNRFCSAVLPGGF